MILRFNDLRGLIEGLAPILLMVLIVLTPVSSKAINLAWILLVMMVVWQFTCSARIRRISPDSQAVRSALAVLAAFFTAGLLLKIGMQLFWGEPIRGVAFELTAAAAAGAAWAMAPYWQTDRRHLTLLAAAFLVASGLASLQAYGYVYTGHAGPTNAVNWGAGIGLFMCIALAISVHEQALRHDSWLLFLSLLGFSLALVVAGRRGAFFAILWVMAWECYFWSRMVRSGRVLPRGGWLMLLVIPILAIVLATSDPLPAPIQRIVSTVEEVSLRLEGDHDSGNSPTGTLGPRIYQYKQGLKAGAASPLVGLGAQERAKLIKLAESHWGGAGFFHMHNEYLQAWVAYGIPGLLGVLCFPFGLAVAGWHLRQEKRALSLALIGLGSVHFVSGLTNVNTFHNYYGSIFAVCVVASVLFLSREHCSFERSLETN